MILASLPLLFCLLQGDPEPYLEKADGLAAEGRFEQALAVLDDAGAPGDVRILTARGTYLLRDAEARGAAGRLEGDELLLAFEEAAKTLEQAAAGADAPPEAWIHWSEALLNLDDPGAALKVMERARAVLPGDLGVALQTGRVYGALAAGFQDLPEKQRAAWEQARTVFADAAQSYAGSAVACVRLGEMEVYLGNPPAARAAWREAVRRDASAVDLGAMIRWIGAAPAARILRQAQEEGGEDATLLWWQAFAEYSDDPRQWTEARAHFQRVLDLNPEFGTSWYYLGEGAMAEGVQLQEAGDAKAAQREFGLAAKAWARYVGLYGPAYLQGLRQKPDRGAADFAAKSWLANQAYVRGDRSSAYTLARWIARSQPADAVAWNNYAFLSREYGQDEESLEAYRHADRLKPDDPQILNDMALILHYNLKRDLDEAKRLYERAIDLAEKMLADPAALPEVERDLVATALKDATNNLRLLRRQLGEDVPDEAGGEAGS